MQVENPAVFLFVLQLAKTFSKDLFIISLGFEYLVCWPQGWGSTHLALQVTLTHFGKAIVV